MYERWRIMSVLATLSTAALITLATAQRSPQQPVGLSLIFDNGKMAPVTLIGDAPRYPQEIDLIATATTRDDEGIVPLTRIGDMAALDWAGIQMVEETWNPQADGTYIRQRFYRNANWMKNSSTFQIVPLDAGGSPAGEAMTVRAGRDGDDSEDGWVRRFVARQTATGCPKIGDTTGATFTAEGLAQWRDALHPQDAALSIPANAAQLKLTWDQDPRATRLVKLAHVTPDKSPYGYGFKPSLDIINPPSRGFFRPGNKVLLRLTFRDGNGKRLHPAGVMPSYADFVNGKIDSGLRYYDGLRLNPTIYYALKHRESNLLLSLSGPTDRLHTPQGTVGFDHLFDPQVAMATVALDGFTSCIQMQPPLADVFIPKNWNNAITDVVTFVIPQEAKPGTYLAAMKARREYGGEALNRAVTLEIQVGTPLKSLFTAKTGNCGDCHEENAGFSHILHGVSDRRACFSCHGSLAFEPDNALDIRVHTIHDRSARFRTMGGSMNDCSLCHLTKPMGAARGVLNSAGQGGSGDGGGNDN